MAYLPVKGSIFSFYDGNKAWISDKLDGSTVF
jgi:hypothetical protein